MSFMCMLAKTTKRSRLTLARRKLTRSAECIRTSKESFAHLASLAKASRWMGFFQR